MQHVWQAYVFPWLETPLFLFLNNLESIGQFVMVAGMFGLSILAINLLVKIVRGY